MVNLISTNCLFTGTPVVVANANVSVTGQSVGTLTTGTATVEAITLVPVSTNLVETFMEDVTVQDDPKK